MHVNNQQVEQPAQAEATQSSGNQFVLITINDILVTTDSLELIGKNVLTFKRLIEGGESVILLFTIPEELMGEQGAMPESVRKQIESLLDTAGLYQAGLKSHRVIFSETTEGRGSIARQIQPLVFMDPDEGVVTSLVGKVPNAVHVDADRFKGYVMQQFIAVKDD